MINPLVAIALIFLGMGIEAFTGLFKTMSEKIKQQQEPGR